MSRSKLASRGKCNVCRSPWGFCCCWCHQSKVRKASSWALKGGESRRRHLHRCPAYRHHLRNQVVDHRSVPLACKAARAPLYARRRKASHPSPGRFATLIVQMVTCNCIVLSKPVAGRSGGKAARGHKAEFSTTVARVRSRPRSEVFERKEQLFPVYAVECLCDVQL